VDSNRVINLSLEHCPDIGRLTFPGLQTAIQRHTQGEHVPGLVGVAIHDRLPSTGQSLDATLCKHIALGLFKLWRASCKAPDAFIGTQTVSNSQSPRELSISEFVDAYVRRIAQLPGCEKVVFDPVNRVIRFEYQGQMQFARPQTAYAEYKKDISRLDALLDAHINAIQFMQTEIPRSFAAVAPTLMPMVRDRRYLDMALLTARVSGPRVLEVSEIAAFLHGLVAVIRNSHRPLANGRPGRASGPTACAGNRALRKIPPRLPLSFPRAS
jgi:hypothetical protein